MSKYYKHKKCKSHSNEKKNCKKMNVFCVLVDWLKAVAAFALETFKSVIRLIGAITE